ncbi:MAG: TetR/AcrR family transcriptional regulator [Anaerolineae bacterium]|jgi:AcrR family transcriptional regulator
MMAIQQRGAETRANILVAAAAGFAEQGYDATGVAEICRRAEVSKGAFYHHFSSKQALFLELLERWLAVLDEQLEEVRTGEAAVPEQLLDMTEMIRQVFQVAEEQIPIFLEFWTKAARDPTVWEATIAPYRRYRAFFANLIEAGVTEGTLRSVEPDTTARIIVSLAVGLVVQGLLDTEGADWGHVAEAGMQMLLQGMEKKE